MSDEPVKEVFYLQEPYDPAIDYSSWFYFWTPELQLSSEWLTLETAPYLDAVRVWGGIIQFLSVVVHEPKRTFKLENEDPIAALFEKIKRLKPLPEAEEIQVYFGHSRRWYGDIYMRAPSPPRAFTPSIDARDLWELLHPVGMGVEDADHYSRSRLVAGEWFVAYIRRVNQPEFERAYSRLTLLLAWIDHASRRMYRVAERLIKVELKEMHDRSLAQSEARVKRTVRP